MVKGKWIDKNNAVTFKLVHRPQNDPLIHDDAAPSMVLAPTASSSSKTGKSIATLSDLASQLGSEAESVRDNEGEAADHGVYYDDTNYDYMQHLRDPGTLGAGVVVMEPGGGKKQNTQGKGKGQSLEQALREMDLRDKTDDLKLDADILPSRNLERQNYQAQQEIQDSIRGFQPDMNPELREVLEALEDDAYVDDDDDIFQELAKDAKEISSHEFGGGDYGDDEFWDDEDEGWESDVTEKPSENQQARPSATTAESVERKADPENEDEEEVPTLVRVPAPVEPTSEDQNPDWLSDFHKFKQDQKHQQSSNQQPRPFRPQQASKLHDGLSSIITGHSSSLANNKKKPRKGALTNPSTYSMTSSALFRTEQQRLLDDRFEARLLKLDEEIDDRATRMSTMSSVTTAPREDFNAVVDEFLDGFKTKATRGKKGPAGGQDGGNGAGMSLAQRTKASGRGIAQLDEIRKGLGPARLKGRLVAGNAAK